MKKNLILMTIVISICATPILSFGSAFDTVADTQNTMAGALAVTGALLYMGLDPNNTTEEQMDNISQYIYDNAPSDVKTAIGVSISNSHAASLNLLNENITNQRLENMRLASLTLTPLTFNYIRDMYAEQFVIDNRIVEYSTAVEIPSQYTSIVADGSTISGHILTDYAESTYPYKAIASRYDITTNTNILSIIESSTPLETFVSGNSTHRLLNLGETLSETNGSRISSYNSDGSFISTITDRIYLAYSATKYISTLSGLDKRGYILKWNTPIAVRNSTTILSDFPQLNSTVVLPAMTSGAVYPFSQNPAYAPGGTYAPPQDVTSDVGISVPVLPTVPSGPISNQDILDANTALNEALFNQGLVLKNMDEELHNIYELMRNPPTTWDTPAITTPAIPIDTPLDYSGPFAQIIQNIAGIPAAIGEALGDPFAWSTPSPPELPSGIGGFFPSILSLLGAIMSLFVKVIAFIGQLNSIQPSSSMLNSDMIYGINYARSLAIGGVTLYSLVTACIGMAFGVVAFKLLRKIITGVGTTYDDSPVVWNQALKEGFKDAGRPVGRYKD